MGYVQMVLQKKNPFLTHEEQDAATMLTDIHSVASIRENEIRLVGKKSIIIPALNFYGVYTSSPNNRFRIAWCDGLGRGNGLYVLIKGDDIIC